MNFGTSVLRFVNFFYVKSLFVSLLPRHQLKLVEQVVITCSMFKPPTIVVVCQLFIIVNVI